MQIAYGITKWDDTAQSAGIDHNLGHNEIKDLIDKSAEVKYETNREYDIEIQLGKRTKHVNIVREKDCTSIKPQKVDR